MDVSRPPVYRVGDVDIDLGARLFRRHGHAVHLRRQTFQLLVHLLAHRERVLTKDELLRAVWGDIAVSDDALTQCVKELRRAFDDDTRDPRFIRTVPKVGYQFVGTVEDRTPVTVSTTSVEHVRTVSVEVEERADAARWPLALRVVAAGALALVAGLVSWSVWRALVPAERGAVAAGERTATRSLEAYRAYSLGLERAEAFHEAEAIDLLKRAIALDPNFVMAQARIGYIYATSNTSSRDEAKPYLERAFQHSAGLPEHDRLSIRAWYAVATSDYTGAIDRYREIVARDPNDVEAYWRLGRLLLGEERYEEGIAVLKQGLAINPDSRQISNELGSAYVDARQYDDAIRARQRYVALAPAEPNAFDSLGLVYQAAGRFSDALAAYDRAAALDSGFSLAPLHRGNLRFRIGQYRLALNDYRRFIELSPRGSDKSRGYLQMAWVSFRRGDVDAALAFRQTAEKVDGHTDMSWI
jgi:DNA-binding winged helix-turn-helix (wHTH) protein/tetratricopeptide (TPR) repeat protein